VTSFNGKIRGSAVAAAAFIGLSAVSLTTPASAGLMGDTVFINGNPYTVGPSAPMTFQDGWLYGLDDSATVSITDTTIDISLYAPESIFVWNHTDGANFTISIADLDWAPSWESFQITTTAYGDAQDGSFSAYLYAGVIDVSIPGWLNCGSSDCGGIKIELSAVPEPATLAVFGLGLVGMGWTRRRKSV
jgi:hypothetical protein